MRGFGRCPEPRLLKHEFALLILSLKSTLPRLCLCPREACAPGLVTDS